MNFSTRNKVLIALLCAAAVVTATVTFAKGAPKPSGQIKVAVYQDKRNGGTRYDQPLPSVNIRYACSPKNRGLRGTQFTRKNGSALIRKINRPRVRKSTCRIKVVPPVGYATVGKATKKVSIKRGQKKTVKVALRAKSMGAHPPRGPGATANSQSPATNSVGPGQPGTGPASTPTAAPDALPQVFEGNGFALRYPASWKHVREYDEELGEPFDYLATGADLDESEAATVDFMETTESPEAYYNDGSDPEAKVLEKRSLTVAGHPAYFVREEAAGMIIRTFYIGNGQKIVVLDFTESYSEPGNEWRSENVPTFDRIVHSIQFR